MPEILQSLEGVVVRPALASDKAAVLQFCQQTWPDIEDYIASVWDKWMADVSGQILVALLNERPVAMARVVRLSDVEGWWEGLRVEPQYRGRGLVSVLEHAVKQYFREVGVSVGGFFPKTDLMLGCLTQAGYHPSPQEEVLVYEAMC